LCHGQAPFHKFYTDEEKATYYDTANAVGELFPNQFIARGGPSMSGHDLKPKGDE